MMHLLELFLPPNHWKKVLSKARRALRDLEQGTASAGTVYDTTDLPVMAGSLVHVSTRDRTVRVAVYYRFEQLERIMRALRADGYKVTEPSELLSSRPAWAVDVRLAGAQR